MTNITARNKGALKKKLKMDLDLDPEPKSTGSRLIRSTG
jgi:hypothetical protein